MKMKGLKKVLSSITIHIGSKYNLQNIVNCWHDFVIQPLLIYKS